MFHRAGSILAALLIGASIANAAPARPTEASAREVENRLG